MALSPCTLALGYKKGKHECLVIDGPPLSPPLPEERERERDSLLAREEILQQMSMERAPTLYTLMPYFGFFVRFFLPSPLLVCAEAGKEAGGKRRRFGGRKRFISSYPTTSEWCSHSLAGRTGRQAGTNEQATLGSREAHLGSFFLFVFFLLLLLYLQFRRR